MVDHESKLIKLKRKKVAGKKEPTFGFSLKRHERVDGQIINVVCDCKDFAVKKGLKNNQQLIQINMQSVEGLSLPEMVALVKNTPEKITLLTQPLDPEILHCVQKFWSGSEIWSFLDILRIIFGQKIEIFKIV